MIKRNATSPVSSQSSIERVGKDSITFALESFSRSIFGFVRFDFLKLQSFRTTLALIEPFDVDLTKCW